MSDDLTDLRQRLADALVYDYFIATDEAANEAGVTKAHLVHLRRTAVARRSTTSTPTAGGIAYLKF